MRFNWHFYVMALVFVIMLGFLDSFLPAYGRIANRLLILGTVVSSCLSLLVSYYVYDFSDLYRLDWLKCLPIAPQSDIINVHAGFDETSFLFQKNFPEARLRVFDFYNPLQHTEVSIKRARKAYPPFPNTQTIETKHLPLPDTSVGTIFVVLSAHEIRQDAERVLFFQELRRTLHPEGRIVVVEHLRDMPNFIAYNIGFFHFLSKKSWLTTFQKSSLSIAQSLKITPFITVFILKKNGTAS
jgi:SAM-dependent methyltransferase